MIELNHEQFEARQELAKVSGEISTSKVILADLKKDIQKFLDERKVKEQEMLKKLYEESKELVDSIQKNYKDIRAFYNDIRSYTGFLKEMGIHIDKIYTDYNEDGKEFIKFLNNETEKLAEIRKDLETERKQIDIDVEDIKKQRKDIEKDRIHLESQKETLSANFKELKKLWNKNL